MKIILAPTVTVLSIPSFTEHPTYKLPRTAEPPYSVDAYPGMVCHERREDGTPGPGLSKRLDGTPSEQLIATGGKVCYDSYGEDGRPIDQHIDNLLQSEHFSVIEHANVSLFIEGISRGCSHEIVRHRHFSYSQRSTRYTNESDCAFVLNPWRAEVWRRANMSLEKHPSFSRGRPMLLIDGKTYSDDIDPSPGEDVLAVYRFVEACERGLAAYQAQMQLMEHYAPKGGTAGRKWLRGQARDIMPHALETRMVMTGNLRSWREFLIKRTNRGAEAEMRRLAHQIFLALYPIAPTVFRHLLPETRATTYDEFHNVIVANAGPVWYNVVDGYMELTPRTA